MASRDERDLRGDRFESEIRTSEQQALSKVNSRKGLPFCERCRTAFEEISRTCPRCEKKTMGYLRMIPEDMREQARENAIRRARRGL